MNVIKLSLFAKEGRAQRREFDTSPSKNSLSLVVKFYSSPQP